MAEGGKSGDGTVHLPDIGRLLVRPETKDLSPYVGDSYAEVHPDTAEQLQVFENDTVELHGNRRRIKVVSVRRNDKVAPGEVAVNDVSRRTLGIKSGDRILVKKCDVGPLQKADIAVVKESIEGLRHDTASLMQHVLVPYFREARRILGKGDLFKYPLGGREIEFRVNKISPFPVPGQKKRKIKHGYVVPGTGTQNTMVNLIEKPISRDDIEEDLSAIGYADIGGLGDQLQTIRETIELPIRHPKLFSTIGVKPPKGVLLHGPPGCGKTLIAKAIANETGANFTVINGPEIISGKFGGSEQRLKAEFESAAENAPAIIFIDEIDAIAPSRDKSNDEHLRRVVATLLTCMDGVKTGSNVLVIGATNRPNALDMALRRAGRFDTEVVIPVPNKAGRREILNILTKKQKLAEDVDLDKIAEVTHGYVGADLAALCMKAAISCIRKTAREILDLDLEDEDLPADFLANLKVHMEDFYEALEQTGPSMTRDVVVETPSVSFNDIGGLEAVKQELKEMIELPVKYPELFEEAGKQVRGLFPVQIPCGSHLPPQPPSGVLMYGPPGCGKTMLAKAMANECQANFISVKGPQLLTKWFGESEENVREVFDKARQVSPCILFFDELDAIAAKRGGYGAMSAGGAADRVVNQLLTEMDGLADRKNLFIVGATNRLDTVDDAVKRQGRLDQLVYIPVPDLEARRSIFQAILKNTRVSRNADIDAIARDLEGYTGADIASLCQMAIKISVRKMLKAKMEGQSVENWEVTPECFERAKDVSEADLQMYSRMRDQLAAESSTSGSTLTTVAVPTTGKYRVTGGQPALDDEEEDVPMY